MKFSPGGEFHSLRGDTVSLGTLTSYCCQMKKESAREICHNPRFLIYKTPNYITQVCYNEKNLIY